MTTRTTYYAIIDHRATREDPAGIARRRPLESGGFRDEALDRGLNWQFTPLIVEWKRAESTDGSSSGSGLSGGRRASDSIRWLLD